MTDLAHDYLGLDDLLTPDERVWRDQVRAFVDDRIRPSIADWYEQARARARYASVDPGRDHPRRRP